MDNRVGVLLATVATLGLFLATGAALADKQHKDKDKEKLAVDKVKGPLSVLVLGSGGPVAAPSGRASAAYLIFCDGEPCVLMDAGGGAYQRLAASGANVRNLDIVLLSHLHIDHTGDLSSIIKTIYFHARGSNLANDTFPPGRTAPIRIFGPAANGAEFPPVLGADPGVAQYPSSSEYVHGHYDLNTGLERYLNIFSRATRQLPSGIPVNIMLFPMEGDFEAPISFWSLALVTGGSFMTVSRDWP